GQGKSGTKTSNAEPATATATARQAPNDQRRSQNVHRGFGVRRCTFGVYCQCSEPHRAFQTKKSINMKQFTLLTLFFVAFGAVATGAQTKDAAAAIPGNPASEIRDWLDRWTKAFTKQDVDA